MSIESPYPHPFRLPKQKEPLCRILVLQETSTAYNLFTRQRNQIILCGIFYRTLPRLAEMIQYLKTLWGSNLKCIARRHPTLSDFND